MALNGKTRGHLANKVKVGEDTCMHVCVHENVEINVHVDSRATRVLGEALASAEVRGKLI